MASSLELDHLMGVRLTLHILSHGITLLPHALQCEMMEWMTGSNNAALASSKTMMNAPIASLSSQITPMIFTHKELIKGYQTLAANTLSKTQQQRQQQQIHPAQTSQTRTPQTPSTPQSQTQSPSPSHANSHSQSQSPPPTTQAQNMYTRPCITVETVHAFLARYHHKNVPTHVLAALVDEWKASGTHHERHTDLEKITLGGEPTCTLIEFVAAHRANEERDDTKTMHGGKHEKTTIRENQTTNEEEKREAKLLSYVLERVAVHHQHMLLCRELHKVAPNPRHIFALIDENRDHLLDKNDLQSAANQFNCSSFSPDIAIRSVMRSNTVEAIAFEPFCRFLLYRHETTRDSVDEFASLSASTYTPQSSNSIHATPLSASSMSRSQQHTSQNGISINVVSASKLFNQQPDKLPGMYHSNSQLALPQPSFVPNHKATTTNMLLGNGATPARLPAAVSVSHSSDVYRRTQHDLGAHAQEIHQLASKPSPQVRHGFPETPYPPLLSVNDLLTPTPLRQKPMLLGSEPFLSPDRTSNVTATHAMSAKFRKPSEVSNSTFSTPMKSRTDSSLGHSRIESDFTLSSPARSDFCAFLKILSRTATRHEELRRLATIAYKIRPSRLFFDIAGITRQQSQAVYEITAQHLFHWLHGVLPDEMAMTIQLSDVELFVQAIGRRDAADKGLLMLPDFARYLQPLSNESMDLTESSALKPLTADERLQAAQLLLEFAVIERELDDARLSLHQRANFNPHAFFRELVDHSTSRITVASLAEFAQITPKEAGLVLFRMLHGSGVVSSSGSWSSELSASTSARYTDFVTAITPLRT